MSDLIFGIMVLTFILSPFVLVVFLIYYFVKKIRQKRQEPKIKRQVKTIKFEKQNNPVDLKEKSALEKSEVEIPELNKSDILFVNTAYLEFQNQRYELGAGAFNDLFMNMIVMFVHYMNTLDETVLNKFKEDEKSINRINKSIGDSEINYGERLLKMYKKHYSIKN